MVRSCESKLLKIGGRSHSWSLFSEDLSFLIVMASLVENIVIAWILWEPLIYISFPPQMTSRDTQSKDSQLQRKSVRPSSNLPTKLMKKSDYGKLKLSNLCSPV